MSQATLPARRRLARPLIAFILVALNLRIALASLSPVLDEVQRDTGMSATTAGLLTAVPVACFSLFAFLASPLSRRLGRDRLLCWTMALLAAGILLRVPHGVGPLFAGTVLIGAALGLANALMPVVVKSDFAGHAGLATAMYTTALAGGAAIAAGLTVPLITITGLDWRPALAVWLIPAALAAIAWRLQTRPAADRPAESTTGTARSWRAVLTDPTSWAVTIFMGMQSLGYYAALAWLPTLLRDHGVSAATAGWLLSLSSLVGIASSLAAPLLDHRVGGGPVPVLVTTVLCLIAYAGLALAPAAAPSVWMLALGLGQGLGISLAIYYIVARSHDHHHTRQLSSMAQGIGYLLACAGPVALGALHHVSDGWSVPVVVLGAVTLVGLAGGTYASRPRTA